MRIVDARNRLRAVYNVNTHDLSVATNRATLKALFLEAARATDSDQDGLLDDWEEAQWGTLAAQPREDPDADGADNATEFAFGSDPKDPQSRPPPLILNVRRGANPGTDVTFRRRVGSMIDYVLEGAADLGIWAVEPVPPGSADTYVNRFDGTGMGAATLVFQAPAGSPGSKFLRLRAVYRR